jgi:hypothetical protein
MDYYFWILSFVGGLFALALFLALVVRCCNPGIAPVAHGAGAFNYVKIDLESEGHVAENYGTISLLLSRSNSAYTINVLCAVLVGITVGFEYARADGMSAMPTLGNLGLIFVLLSPGNQDNDKQERDCCCCPVEANVRGALHNLGIAIFGLGLLGGIVWHGLLLRDCWDPGWGPHDITFVSLFSVFLATLVLWVALWWLGIEKKKRCCSDRVQFVTEVCVIVGGLATHFAHSVNSNVTTDPRNCTWI